MSRFFVDEPVKDFFEIKGEDAYHIIKSLRMKLNEKVILTNSGMDYECKIIKINQNSVNVELLTVKECVCEPRVKVTLFQGLPKGDKMDLIVQKAVEVGVSEIVPTLTSRCISTPDEKSLQKKTQRWQKIALEAAKQAGRCYVPKILNAMSFNEAINFAKSKDKIILFYENGGEALSNLIHKNEKTISIFVGPEGGFESDEVLKIKNAQGFVCSLGKRIFRTETAAIVTSALTIYEYER